MFDVFKIISKIKNLRQRKKEKKSGLLSKMIHGRGGHILALAFAVLCAAPAVYAACLSPAGEDGDLRWFSGESTYKYCIDDSWVALNETGTLGSCSTPGLFDYDSGEGAFKQCDGSNWQKVGCDPSAGGGGFLCPGGGGCSSLGSCSVAGQVEYNKTNDVVEYCDGTDWYPMAPVSSGGGGPESTDYSNHSWTQTSSGIPNNERGKSATLLDDGSVLFCGGSDSSSLTTNCYKFSPTSDSWNQVSSMPGQGRWRFAMLTLSDGRVLTCGGNTASNYDEIDRCDLYDPDSDNWTQVANLPEEKMSMLAAPLDDGRALVCGGSDYWLSNGVQSETSQRCDIYDPDAGIWTRVADLPFPSSTSDNNRGAVLLPDGDVFACIGVGLGDVECYKYNGENDQWSGAASARDVRGNIFELISDNNVLRCGGYDPTTIFMHYNTCDVYNIDADSWEFNIASPYVRVFGAMSSAPLNGEQIIHCVNTRCFVLTDQCGCGSAASCNENPDATPPLWSTLGKSADPYDGLLYDAYDGNVVQGVYVHAWDYSGTVSYSKVSGPSWLSVNSTTGEVSGNFPSNTGGNFDITIRAQDSAGNSSDRTFYVEVYNYSGAKVLCTYYHSRRLISEHVFDGDNAYAGTVHPNIVRAYHAWAGPLIAWLKKNEGGFADRFVYAMVRAWAQEMAYRTGYAEEGSTLGWWLSEIGEPLHYLAGYFIPESEEQKQIRAQMEIAQYR